MCCCSLRRLKWYLYFDLQYIGMALVGFGRRGGGGMVGMVFLASGIVAGIGVVLGELSIG